MSSSLSNSKVRGLKALSQRLEPVCRVGRTGLSSEFLSSVNAALDAHELVKIKFIGFKEQKKELAPILAEKTGSALVSQVGNVIVLYRRNPESSKHVLA